MKNIILKFNSYLYYLILIALLILYLFPGSLIGYFLYGNLGQQPDLIPNPIGTSINHLISFIFLSSLAFIVKVREKKFINSFLFLLFLSFSLELLHLIIPNRAFELNDLLANITGVITIFFLFRLKKRFTK